MKLQRALAGAALALAVIALLISPVGQVGEHEAQQIASSAMEAVGSAFQAMFPTAQSLGPLPAGATLDVGVGLPVHDAAGLGAFIQATQTPGSPLYHQFLTPTQFDATYAPSPDAYARSLAYFEGFGLDPQVSSDRLLLGVTGSPAAMGAAFHTSFARYDVNGATYYGPTSVPQLPPGLGVSGAFGLTDAFNAQPSFHLLPGASAAAIPAACTGGLTPTQVWDAYRLNAVIAAGHTASGEKIAVVDTYDTAQAPSALTSDINAFDSNCAVSSVTPQYQFPVHNWPSGNSSSQWGVEIALDMQWSHAMGESAGLYPVLTPDSGFSLYEGVNYLVETHLVDTVSLSWGFPDVGLASGCTASIGCNASTAGVYAVFHPVLQAAVAEGMSVTVASGDCGAADGGSVTSTDYPASDEDATGIGGTTLTLSGNGTYYGSESGWSGNHTSATCGNQGGAGGGWAPVPQPWYQTGTGVRNKGLRGVPDVGITVGTALSTYYGGGGTGVYGTSDGAPQWAGLIATADGIAGHELGLINPALYGMLRNPSYGGSGGLFFHDITSGSNGYSAGTGWDPVTGVGTPITTEVLPYLAANAYLPPAGTLQAGLTATPTSGSGPLSVAFAVSATGGTGTYLYNYYWGDATSDQTKAAALSHTYASAGTYAAQVEVYDSSGNSTTTVAIMITVGATSSVTLTLAASTTSPTVGQPVTFTATASGGTSPYGFGYYYGDGTWTFANAKASSPNSLTHTYGAAGVYCADATANDSSSPQLGATSNILTILVGGATGACSAPLSASASGSPTSGSAPLTVVFSGSATGGTAPYTYAWRYNDGQTVPSSFANPTHQYNASGSFTAKLWVNDSASHTATAQVPVTVSASSLLATSSANRTSGYAALAIAFTGSASGGVAPYAYNWGFGDGQVATGQQNPGHTYGSAGTYHAYLYVNDSAAHAAVATPITITVNALPGQLQATASVTPTSGAAPLTVAFTGGASGGTAPYTYSWDFGDGSALSALQNPSHTYSSVGTFTATLTVTDNVAGTATAQATVSVSSGTALTVSASSNVTQGPVALSVQFNAAPSGGTAPYGYAWHFGDGGTNAAQNPVHTYTATGTYTAWVNVSDAASGLKMSNTITIVVTAVGAALSVVATASPTSGGAPLSVAFTATAAGGTGTYTSYVWTFGDGGSSTGFSASHTYGASGSFSATVQVTDSASHTATSPAVAIQVTGSVSQLTGSVSLASPTVTEGTSTTFTATASGGTPAYHYAWSGLPAGCATADTASLTCVPSATGPFLITVVISDSGAQSITRWAHLNVTAASASPAPTILGLSPLDLGLLLVVVVAAIVVAALLLRRARRHRDVPPPAPWQAPPPGGYGPGGSSDLSGYLNAPQGPPPR